jgi:hypothetical protein
MPALCATKAPCFCRNLGKSLPDFLHEYKVLANNHGLLDPQKIETITQYTPTHMHEFWEMLDGYAAKDWSLFCATLKNLYLDTAALSYYSFDKLQLFVDLSTHSHICNEDNINIYHLHFLQLSNPLHSRGDLLDSKHG